ncbi:hypothetical protein [Clostridium omnivorum]|uniref:Uncharacterized protein n=1 Tax=Clostridium omnivorum TaxID=1604902 RepID=A0ABQ5NA57_9CLOT|nr:hypothetical protein [Clostridium sp. E14]GLC32108.1 hypothetical protein bsdE14_35180 [Clostridium sp. E14]
MSKFKKLLVILLFILAIELLMIYIGYRTNLKTSAPGETDKYNKESYMVLYDVNYNF